MKPAAALLHARTLLTAGWHEPFSADVQGQPCHADDEGVAAFCLDDALRLAAGSIEGAVELELTLQRTLRLTGCADGLHTWLQHPSRTHAEVLVLLARAHRHALAEESRHV